MLERKIKADEISQMSGVPRRTLSRLVKDIDEKGFESLRNKKHKGKSSRLSAEQKEELKGILSKTAEEQGYYKWDGVTLSDYIKKKYDIDLKVRQCQRLFHELGFSRIRPQIFPSESEQNEEAREEYKKTDDIEKMPDVILVFQDEVHYTVQTNITAMWALKGSKPKIKSYPSPQRCRKTFLHRVLSGLHRHKWGLCLRLHFHLFQAQCRPSSSM